MLMGKCTFVGIGSYTMEPNWSIRRHSHRFHEMVILCKGKLSVQIDSHELVAKQGDILIYPSGMHHKEWNGHEGITETLYLGWIDYNQRSKLLIHDTDGRLRMLAQWLLKEVSCGFNKEEFKIAFLASILEEYNRLCQNANETDMIRQIRTFMRENISRPLTLDDLAEQVYLSKYHFARTYKKLAGTTPMQDLQAMQAQIARDLIMITELPLKAISSKVGLSSVSRLSKIFKKHFGTPPTFFRKK